jgi:hypothetical protein
MRASCSNNLSSERSRDPTECNAKSILEDFTRKSLRLKILAARSDTRTPQALWNDYFRENNKKKFAEISRGVSRTTA